jgi:hypothetical protein
MKAIELFTLFSRLEEMAFVLDAEMRLRWANKLALRFFTEERLGKSVLREAFGKASTEILFRLAEIRNTGRARIFPFIVLEKSFQVLVIPLEDSEFFFLFVPTNGDLISPIAKEFETWIQNRARK